MTKPLYLLSSINVSKDHLPMAKTFIDYYYSLGVNKFFLVLNGLDREIRKFVKYMDGLDIPLFHIPWVTEYHAHIRDGYVSAMLEELRRNVEEYDWVFTVDADEFFVFPDDMKWDEFSQKLEEEKSHYLVSFFLDMVSEDLTLVDFKYGMELFETYPTPTLFTHNVMKAEVQKIPLSMSCVGRNRFSCHTIPARDAKGYRYYPQIIPMRHFRLTKTNVESLMHKANIYKSGPKYNQKAKKYMDGYKFVQDPSKLESVVIDVNKTITSVSYNHWKIRKKPGLKMKLYCENSVYGSKAISEEEEDTICKINLSSIGFKGES